MKCPASSTARGRSLDDFLEPALALFHPVLAADIDWNLGYEKLDTGLSEIVRDAELGPTIADRLFRVKYRSGETIVLLIHIKVQTQYDPDLARRMFVNYCMNVNCGIRSISSSDP